MPLVPHVSPNTTITSVWGNLVADHVVMRFTNATQRSSQLTAPVLNQLSMLDSRPAVIQAFGGSTWLDVVPLVTSGTANITTNASGDYVFGLPAPYQSPPVVLVQNATPTVAAMFSVHTITTTAFTVRSFRGTDGVAFAGSFVMQWLAVGPKA